LPASDIMFGESLPFSQRINEASLIVIGRVDKIEHWKKRNDWLLVNLIPDQFLKGSASSPLKILDTKLFSQDAGLFLPGDQVLVFLRELPPYTAWQELIGQGIQYGVLGARESVIKKAPDISLFSGFISQVLRLPKNQEGVQKMKLKELYSEILKKNPPGELSAEITRDFLGQFPAASQNASERAFWLERVKDPFFPKAATLEVAKAFSEVSGPESSQVLQEMFCLPPPEICLRVAEALESRGLKQSLSSYEKELAEDSIDMRLGLLAILARHQRKDAFSLFAKYLSQEKNEKNASGLVEALGDFGSSQAEKLVLAYAKDPRYYVRIAVATSLGKLKSTKGIPVLETYLKTQDPSMVTVAAQALQQIGTPQALNTLGKYYEKGHHGHWEPVEPQHFNLPPANP